MARRTEEKEKRKTGPDGTMSVVDHLRELRDRIIWSLIAVAVGSTLVFIFFGPIVHLLMAPYKSQTHQALIYTGVIEGFMIRIKVAAYGGLVVASPVVFFHLWRFITPGLNPNEKRYAVPFVVSAIVLFLGGTVVAAFTLPPALKFLLAVGGNDLHPLITANSYLTLIFLMALAFGVSFEFPILMMFLLLARIVHTSQLRKVRKYAFLGIVVFAAVITPSQDPISLFAMAIPMYLLYEASIIIGRILKR
ncbi:MAG TPA: twin-arginine translocase subunit TatC [Acidimicrobiia bacterium]|nr:twin-arginine translocase subunit TatC [Acidimicrobiia bacterium]